MNETNIDIGVSLSMTLHLTIFENTTVPFEIDRIVDVYEKDGSTIVKCYGLVKNYEEYTVLDSVKDVKDALNSALKLKEKGIECLKDFFK